MQEIPRIERWSDLEEQIAALRIAIERSRAEASQNFWVLASLCMFLAVGPTVIGTGIYPRPPAEDPRLQRLGADLEQRWQTMTAKERAQIEKILGWSRPTGRRAQSSGNCAPWAARCSKSGSTKRRRAA